jgi:hypothetical protein
LFTRARNWAVSWNNQFFFLWRYSPNSSLGLPPWNSPFHFSLLDFRHSEGLLGGGGVISSSQGLYLYTKTHIHTQTPNIHFLSWIRTYGPGLRASEDSACLRPLGYRDRLEQSITSNKFTSYFCQVHFNIIPHLCLGIPTGFSLQIFQQKFYRRIHVSFAPSALHVAP